MAGGWGVVVLSALVLSLRFSLITASIVPHLLGRPRWLRALLAYCVTDENYPWPLLVRMAARPDLSGQLLDPRLYGGWLMGTIGGVLLGARVAGVGGPFKLVFPIVFLVLTVLLCTSLPLALVAVVGGILSVLGAVYLPPGWNIIVGGLVASLFGLPLERLLRRHIPSQPQPHA